MYSFGLWTMMGGTKNFPLDRENTIRVNHNDACYHIFTFHMCYPGTNI